MSHPYQPPESELDPKLTVHPTNPTLVRAMTLVSFLVTAAFLYAMWRLSAMYRSDVVEAVADGDLAGEQLYESMLAAAAPASFSLMAGTIGLLILFMVAVFSSLRSRGFFVLCMLNCVLYLMAFPLGTLVSILFIVFLIVKRREFYADEIDH